MTRLFLLLLSAALYVASFPPWPTPWTAWVALIPLLRALDGLPWRRRALAGLAWGVITNFSLGYWVPAAIAFYYEQPLWFAILFCAAGSLVFWAPYYAVFAIGAATYRRGVLLGPALTAALWVTVEFGRAHLLTGVPWLLLGYATAPFLWLRQAADLGGVYLLSFLFAFVNAALAAALHPGSRQRPAVHVGVAAVAVSIVVAYGAWRVGTAPSPGPGVSTLVVQGNNHDSALWQPGQYGEGLENYLALTATAAADTHPTLVVWPEAAVTMFLGREPRFQARIAAVLRSFGADLIVGAPHYEDLDAAKPEYLNSAFYLTRDGQLTGRYDKQHLLPFVEYFPLNIDFVRRRFERVRTFSAAEEPRWLETQLGRTAVAICFEGIFPDLVRRRMNHDAKALVILSNDAWLGDGAGPQQHLTHAILRAVENHTWVVRATTTGVSAIIDPYGTIVAEAASGKPATLNARIEPLAQRTIYDAIGDTFAWTCLAVSALVGCANLGRRRQPG